MTIPTFEEFQASRKEMTWKQCADMLRIDDMYTDAPFARVYWGTFYIEDYGPNWEKRPVNNRYCIVLERDIWADDNLENLERTLYQYCVAEEFFTEYPIAG